MFTRANPVGISHLARLAGSLGLGVLAFLLALPTPVRGEPTRDSAESADSATQHSAEELREIRAKLLAQKNRPTVSELLRAFGGKYPSRNPFKDTSFTDEAVDLK